MKSLVVRRLSAVLCFAPFALACTLVSCSDAPTGGESIGRRSDELFANDKAAYEFFVGKGLKSFQAAGIVGNLDQESGDSPTAVQPGGPGRGLAQWSAGGRWDSDPGDNAMAFASSKGMSVWSLNLQLEFIWFELTSFSGYGLAALKATTNVTDATVVFQNKFEGCGTCVETQRVKYAKDVLAAFGTAPDYAAQYVSQSFPVATTTMTMTAGQVIPSYIELKNVGAKTWDSGTRLATTQPRDRTSVFSDASWFSKNRPAAVVGTVPPGATYRFKFDLAAPDTPGTYDEFFGVVQEGVAWFSDPGQGGPPDNNLEVKIQVVAGKDAGVDAGDGGTKPGGDAGDADVGTGTDARPADGGDADVDGGDVDGGDDGDTTGSVSCGVARSPRDTSQGAWSAAALAMVALLALRRRT